MRDTFETLYSQQREPYVSRKRILEKGYRSIDEVSFVHSPSKVVVQSKAYTPYEMKVDLPLSINLQVEPMDMLSALHLFRGSGAVSSRHHQWQKDSDTYR